MGVAWLKVFRLDCFWRKVVIAFDHNRLVNLGDRGVVETWDLKPETLFAAAH